MVIGGGVAGLSFSLKANKYAEVILLCKEKLHYSSSMLAQGGISAVWDNEDSIQKHINDTLIAGDNLCNSDVVELVVKKAKECIEELINYGVEFSKSTDGILDLAKEGGHSHNRVVHVKDHTGRSIVQILEDKVKNRPNIEIFENHFAIDLILENSICIGASVLNINANEVIDIYADFVVLACGGLGQVYKYNTNPKIATGDGIAIAKRAGATISDMEFVQFHPTMLKIENSNSFLISEAIRGFGAELKHLDGTTFMDKYHKLGSLAPRDIVSRAIYFEMENRNTDCVYLDLTKFNKSKIKLKFPSIYQKTKEVGIDIKKDLIPVVPSAHFICGGIKTDLYGQSSILGLFAIGENACTGFHGANRLASNSLLEGLVFANQASTKINELYYSESIKKNEINSHFTVNEIELYINSSMIQELMWENVGIIRNDSNLIVAYKTLTTWQNELQAMLKSKIISKNSLEILNLIECGLLIIDAAILRNENKGGHFKISNK